MEMARIESKQKELVATMNDRDYSLDTFLPSEYTFVTGESARPYYEELENGGLVKAGIDYRTKHIFCVAENRTSLLWEWQKSANRAAILLQIARASEPLSQRVEDYLYSRKIEGDLEDVLRESYERDKRAVEKAFHIGRELTEQGFPLTETPQELQSLLRNALVGCMRRYFSLLQKRGSVENSQLTNTFYKEGGLDFAFYYW